MTQSQTSSFASALIAATLVIATWTSTLSMPQAHATTAPAPAAAHVILA